MSTTGFVLMSKLGVRNSVSIYLNSSKDDILPRPRPTSGRGPLCDALAPWRC
jgi:hypothetical protein